VCSAAKLPVEEELMDPHPSTEPLDKVACDLFHFEGEQYLMVIDEFSNYGFHHKYKKTPCSEEVINVLKTWFLQVGQMEALISDQSLTPTARAKE
jgi:hypothetical protein